MPIWGQLLIAGVVALGIIGVGKAIITGFAISRRPAHQDTPLREHPPVSSQIPPPPAG
jgi:hypothetical protein